MTSAELGGRVLASVSRSFYLSIRILPPAVREPVGLAYLLARASDTIADSSTSPAALRLQHLAQFGVMVQGAQTTGLPELQRDIQPPDPSEATLIAQLEPLLQWLAAIDAPAREEIQRVLRPIIHGQTLDLQRFPETREAAPLALSTAAELEEYTYLVAGCVGEFWTRICLQRLGTRYSALGVEELSRLGIGFGKGLQLVNILRDLPADLRDGRCYLPEDELRAAGTEPACLRTAPLEARPVFRQWLSRAESLLDEGRLYIRAIRPARVRAACALPWYLGRATLDLLRTTPPLEVPYRLKVSRRYVNGGLWLALYASFSDAPLRGSRHD